jgi:alkylation response protein AidB-like acyl-CoA dehydrogenase
MDFNEPTLQQELRAIARKFAQTELLPIVVEDEKSEKFRPELIQKLGQLGLTGIPIPEAYGGAGLGYQEVAIVIEELSAVNMGYAISIAVTGLTQNVLNIFGNEAQKKKYIPPLAEGKAIGAFSLSESESGSDAAALRTTAKKNGDHYVLNGTKLWTTQGDIASYIVVMARTGEGPKGISAFLIEKGTPGFQLGKREKKMGWNTSHTMELVLNQVKVPAENLIGKEGDGFKIAMTALDSGRINIGACALGIGRASIEIAVKHAKERSQFGKSIGEFQGVSFMLADMKTQWDAAQLLVYKAASIRDSGSKFSMEASVAKLFATDMAMKVTTDAVQILGGSGYTQEFPVERFMREAKGLQIVEGTNQIQRLVIGRGMLQ